MSGTAVSRSYRQSHSPAPWQQKLCYGQSSTSQQESTTEVGSDNLFSQSSCIFTTLKNAFSILSSSVQDDEMEKVCVKTQLDYKSEKIDVCVLTEI